jgi:hypothetical protein
LAKAEWPFRLHTTYDETISRALDVFERVNRDIPLTSLRWFLDHCETISDRNMERVKALGGGIAIQNRMAYQGEYFVNRYGKEKAERTPPLQRMLEMDLPIGAGTDGTRVSSFNPWISLYWLVTGKTVGGLSLYPPKQLMSREQALRLFTQGSAFFSREEDKKGSIEPGKFGDIAVLSDNYFTVDETQLRSLHSVLTIVGGRIVYGGKEFANYNPPIPPAMPHWSPVNFAHGVDKDLHVDHRAHHHSTTGCCSPDVAAFGHDGLSNEGFGCACAVI